MSRRQSGKLIIKDEWPETAPGDEALSVAHLPPTLMTCLMTCLMTW